MHPDLYPYCTPNALRMRPLLYPNYPYCTPTAPRLSPLLYPYCTPAVPQLYPYCTQTGTPAVPQLPLLYPYCIPTVPYSIPTVPLLYPYCTQTGIPTVPPLHPYCTPTDHTAMQLVSACAPVLYTPAACSSEASGHPYSSPHYHMHAMSPVSLNLMILNYTKILAYNDYCDHCKS